MIALLKYWKLAVLLISILGAFAGGWTVKGWQRDSVELEVREDDREKYRLRAQQTQALGIKLEESRDEIRTEYVYLMEEFAAHSAGGPTACLSPDQLRLVNRALGGEATGPGERDGEVPEADANPERR